MGFKKERIGPLLVAASRTGERYRDVHVLFGGTGAVGGTTVLEMLSMYEEMFCITPPDDHDVPIILATGASPEEIKHFTTRLHRFIETRHGTKGLPTRIRNG